MAKIIAVWGSPDSGKTTFAVKLALAIYGDYQTTVVTVCADRETPALPVLFPNRKKDELYSLGECLSKTEITQDEVIRQIVTLKEKQNFGLLGYKDGENRYSYPEYDESKVSGLFGVLGVTADYVIVDCTSSLSNKISRFAVMNADEVIRIASPDLKSLAWQSSQLPMLSDPIFRLDHQILGLNTPDADLYMPIEDAKAHLPEVNFTVPFSRSVKQQMLDGKLLESVPDRKFNNRFHAIVEKVV